MSNEERSLVGTMCAIVTAVGTLIAAVTGAVVLYRSDDAKEKPAEVESAADSNGTSDDKPGFPPFGDGKPPLPDPDKKPPFLP